MDEATPEEVKPFNETIAKEIDRQRKRIGGNFLVVYATATQVDRNRIRKILPDCTFITLTLTREAQKKRILARHHGEETALGLMEVNSWANMELKCILINCLKIN